MDFKVENFINKSAFINNDWHKHEESADLDVVLPANGALFCQGLSANDGQVEKSCLAASEALSAWQALSASERADFLFKIANALLERKDSLANLSHIINGKPLHEALVDVEDAAQCFNYYGQCLSDLPELETVNNSVQGLSLNRRYLPLGVCALITPWNFPLVSSAWKIAPALAAGCTVVLKPSELIFPIEMVWAEIARDIDLPAGVFNMVLGGAKVGDLLCRNPLVQKISFTGSNKVGEIIMKTAACDIKNISLELGGKSAFIVLDDVDIEQAVAWIIGGIYYNAGQMCSATSRLLVPKKIKPLLLEALLKAIKKLKIGSDKDADVGAITFKAQFEKIKNYFQIAKEEGLVCLHGGYALEKGQFIVPTLFDEVPSESVLWQEELFAPVLLIRSYGDEEEAIRLANEGDYGLAGAVACGDVARGVAFARHLRAGSVWVNCAQFVTSEAGWGGFAKSGIGRELGIEGLRAYQGSQYVYGFI